MKNLKWDDIPQQYIGWCVQKIISDGLKLSKKMLKKRLRDILQH